MPLPGGPADKIGNRYERHWSVRALLDLLQGDAISVRLEVPGTDGTGTEFRRSGAEGHGWHQVKRQTTEGAWTIPSLRRQGVLAIMWAKASIGERFTFVSGADVTGLHDLTERARDAESFREFTGPFLESAGLKDDFTRLQTIWNASPEAVHAALRLIHVVVIDEDRLKRWNLDVLRSLVTDPENAADVLGQFIDESLHRELTAEDVWAHLLERGFVRASFITDPDLAAKIDETATGRLSLLRPTLVNHHEIPRAETDDAIAALEDHPAVAVVGSAGAGKSIVLAGIIEWSRNQHRPTLVISADRLPTSPSIHALGSELSLGESPVAALAGVATGRPATLVVDQLDAVSVISGRNPGGTELINSLLSEARSHPNIQTVVACRQFDLDNDRGLSAVAVTEATAVVTVGPLSTEQISGAIELAGLPAVTNPRLLRLLHLPITLSIYIETSKSPAADLTNSKTLTDLYNQYWNEKQRACRRGTDDDWTGVIDALVDTMARNKSLTVPTAVLDSFAGQRDAMISEGVLVGDASRIGFFHESFFDYSFARRFVARDRTLQADLGDQDLFARARVRQVLAYQRSADTPSYLTDLNWLLHTDGVRLHLKELVLGLFETIDDPTDREWATIETIATNPSHPLHTRLLVALRKNPAWFETLDRNRVWERDLQGSDDEVSRALWLLSGPATRAHGERIAELTFTISPPLWKRLRSGFHRMASTNWSNHLDPGLIESIQVGDYDADTQGELWFIMHDLPRTNPSSAAKMIAALVRRAQMTCAPGETDPFSGGGALGRGAHARSERVIEATAREDPLAFASLMVPLISEIAEANVRWDPDEAFQPDRVWQLHYWGEAHEIADELLDATTLAIRLLAAVDPNAARTLLAPLATKPLHTTALLVAAGYAGNPEEFADDAADWIDAHRDALNLGYSNCAWWASRLMLNELTPVCSEATLKRLEDAVLNFTPPDEVTEWAYQAKTRGTTELGLLNGFDEQRRSSRLQRRLAELRRKFKCDDWATPRSVFGAGSIGAPIPIERARHMSDAQWLRAISVHSNPDPDFRIHETPRGGAWSQASVLGTLAEEEPERFARLVLMLPIDTQISYVEAVLRALAKSQIDIELFTEVIRHALTFPADIGRAVAPAIDRHGKLDLPVELIDVLVEQVGYSPGDLDVTDAPTTGLESMDLLTAPSIAVQVIGNLINEDGTRFAHVRAFLAQLAGDSRAEVRAALAGALAPVLYSDEDFAIDVFRDALAGHPPQLLGSDRVEFFIRYAVRKGRYADLEPVIESMLSSSVADIVKAGARQLALASYEDEGLDAKVDQLLADPRPHAREAAVEVFARSIGYAPRRRRSVGVVAAALGDPAEGVRAAAGQVFHETPGLPLSELGPLLSAIAASEAVTEHPGTMAFHWLADSRQALPRTALDICESFVNAAGADIGDIATHAAGDANDVIRIVLRMHTQHHDAPTRARCLDLIDQLLLHRAYGIEAGLDEHDA